MSIIPKNEVDNIVETINSIPDCNTLRQYEIMMIKRLILLLARTLASNKIYQLLVNIPNDLASVIQWIENYINLLLGPYYQLIALEAELLNDYTRIMVAFENKLSLLTCLSNPSQLNPLGGSKFGGMSFGG